MNNVIRFLISVCLLLFSVFYLLKDCSSNTNMHRELAYFMIFYVGIFAGIETQKQKEKRK